MPGFVLPLLAMGGGSTPDYGPAADLATDIAWTHNFDSMSDLSGALQIEYMDAVKARLTDISPWWAYREALQSPIAVGDTAWPRTTYLPAARAHAATSGKRLVMQPWAVHSPGKPGLAAGTLAEQAAMTLPQIEAGHSTWIANIKYSTCVKADEFAPVVQLMTNEYENYNIGSPASGSTAGDIIVNDFPAGAGSGQRNSADGIALNRKRNVLLAKAMREAVDGVGLPAGVTAGPRPCYVAGPVSAFPSMEINAAQPQHTGLRQLAETFDGRILNYLHAVSVHNHRVHSRIPGYDNELWPDDQNSLAAAWQFIAACNALLPASERHQVPCIDDETGIVWDSMPGTWDGGTEYMPTVTTTGGYPAANEYNIALRRYRRHMQVAAHDYLGFSSQIHYATAHSNHEQQCRWDSRSTAASIWSAAGGGDGRHWRPLPDWDHWINLADISRCDAEAFGTAFPTKDWTGFGDLWNWAAYLDMNRAPTGTPLTSPPYDPWGYIKFGTGGVVPGRLRMTGWTLSGYASILHRNLVMRRCWTRYPTREHLFRCRIKSLASSSTARACIRVRGHNKLDGLEDLRQEVRGDDAEAIGSGKVVEIPFRLTGHGLAGLPAAHKFLLCCDHNAVGEFEFSEPELLVR